MKTKLFSFLMLLALPLISYSQVLDSLGCTGALGDVKYSILEHDDFQEVNGDCWTLMDGKIIDPSSELADKGFTFIPDARGVFIRSYDNRQTNRLDVDRNFGDPIGEFQNDEFKNHSHDFYHGAFGNDVRSVPTNANDFSDGTAVRIKNTTETGGNETRPKNITLWTYVRIH